MRPVPALGLEHLPLVELRARPGNWWNEVLAVIGFGEGTGKPPLPEVPAVQVPIPLLDSPPRVEVFRSTEPLQSGRLGRMAYRRGASLLFACVSVSEADCSGRGTALHEATELAYGEIFRSLDALGYPHLLRVWNYFPGINDDHGDGERYWQFNSARQCAFLGAGRSVDGTVPAASALGSRGPAPVTIYGLASRAAPRALENPRQQSAWTYPPQYGPRSPLFSRACLWSGEHGPMLFISGTASILGHQTMHAEDAAEQTSETLRNIRALIARANTELGEPRFAPEGLRYKVYVRREQDLPIVQRLLREQLGPEVPVLYLLADICRRELLVEIEAARV